ncbi:MULTISPECIES: TetR/AcrR family transcriptional regulator [unclassified Curtobacterium]|uniref:TetR/AcrR family transcriptional regulator n=1 Tax=unclassified Curtobacterium TaxID=257496 RepID=UPI000DA72640|nr:MULTISPECIES: TetR/AcrR family transcriptional regulator [unclassified Curtobacterium]PZE23173.1 TetR family transcriptional regulator [Curtobacterium sp. MCBD17_028]PZE73885.1 TetR family transcriptional regulator [Curtobacterium sp. MCBD17_019]
MVRWTPGTRDRLRDAALELFAQQGIEETTVAEIAAAVGVTERTFFRHFADKREVLFAGQEHFQAAFVDAAAGAPRDTTPLEAVRLAVITGGSWFEDDHRAFSRRRQGVILANSGLYERELLKMAALSRAMRDTLRARDVDEPTATLAAETGTMVFRLAFEQWIADDETRSVPEIARERFEQLDALHAAD